MVISKKQMWSNEFLMDARKARDDVFRKAKDDAQMDCSSLLLGEREIIHRAHYGIGPQGFSQMAESQYCELIHTHSHTY